MRRKLQKFSEFANRILPHEADFLLSVQQFVDKDRLAILHRIHYNSQHINQFTPYDTNIDKRKYNHLQGWIKEKLAIFDVDSQFEWMSLMEKKIMTDSILPQEEKGLLKSIRNFQFPIFFFTKFYELVETYAHFLLIRIRYQDYQLSNDFLKKHQASYQKSKATIAKLQEATEDIVAQYSGDQQESAQWINWLTKIFYDEQMDGLNRYLALVRLSFIAFNYRHLDLLKDKYDYMDKYFSQGKSYSKRILLNYYNNRLILHSRSREYEKAAYYGYLSIRDKNHDYISYLNNLCSVLLRLKRYQETLDLLKSTASEVKNTKNFHNRIGFVSFYLEALNKNGLYKNAESYGSSFLRVYHKEILQYRWHLFFSFFFLALLHREQFEKLLSISRKHKLLEKDKQYEIKSSYLPNIPIYIAIAKYKEGYLNQKRLGQLLQNYITHYQSLSPPSSSFKDLIDEIYILIPEVLNQLKS
jgi:hypothetical protein